MPRTPDHLDRFTDVLLDRAHPFWRDERQRAVYTEAATAAFALQTYLSVGVGGACLLAGGRRVLGAVTAMVLCSTASGWLVFATALRRRIELFPGGWRQQSSPIRRRLTLALGAFYAAGVLWTLRPHPGDRRDPATGLAIGAIGAAVLLVAVAALAAKARRRSDASEGPM